MLDKLKSIKSR